MASAADSSAAETLQTPCLSFGLSSELLLVPNIDEKVLCVIITTACVAILAFGFGIQHQYRFLRVTESSLWLSSDVPPRWKLAAIILQLPLLFSVCCVLQAVFPEMESFCQFVMTYGTVVSMGYHLTYLWLLAGGILGLAVTSNCNGLLQRDAAKRHPFCVSPCCCLPLICCARKRKIIQSDTKLIFRLVSQYKLLGPSLAFLQAILFVTGQQEKQAIVYQFLNWSGTVSKMLCLWGLQALSNAVAISSAHLPGVENASFVKRQTKYTVFCTLVPVLAPMAVEPFSFDWGLRGGAVLCSPAVRSLLSACLSSILSLALVLFGRSSFPEENKMHAFVSSTSTTALDRSSASSAGRPQTVAELLALEWARMTPIEELKRFYVSLGRVCEARREEVDRGEGDSSSVLLRRFSPKVVVAPDGNQGYADAAKTKTPQNKGLESTSPPCNDQMVLLKIGRK